jgi:hypothetical protein
VSPIAGQMVKSGQYKGCRLIVEIHSVQRKPRRKGAKTQRKSQGQVREKMNLLVMSGRSRGFIKRGL